MSYVVECLNPRGQALQVGRHARFAAKESVIVYVPLDTSAEIWEWNLNTKKSRRIASGTLPIPSSSDKRIAVIRSSPDSGWQRDSEIWVVDEDHGREIYIDGGHSVCFLPDGSGLLFYRGYECEVRLYSFEEKRVLKVDSPKGYKSPPIACLDGSGCLIRVVTNDRVGCYYLYRKGTDKLVQVVWPEAESRQSGVAK